MTAHRQPDTELWQSREWVEKRLASPQSWNFVVHYLPAEWTDKESDACWLKPSQYDQDHILGLCGVFDAAELGYAFRPKVWGKGIATEAVRGLIKAYWKTFPDGHPGVGDDEKIYLRACTEKSNLASAKVLQKCGFEFWEEVPDPIEVDATGREKSEMLNMWRLWKPGCNGEKATLEQSAE